MRYAVIALCLLAAPALGSDRFAPDNPWFRDFEATCRVGNSLHEECAGGVLGAYAEFKNTTPDSVTCDYEAFWRVRDESMDGKMFSVLPWQYGVEFIVQTEGVCSLAGGIRIQPGFSLN